MTLPLNHRIGRTAYGCVLTSTDAGSRSWPGEAGFDFAWIDLEHSPLTITDAAHLLMALRGTGCAPFIRVAWNVPYLLKPALDLAPAAVIIPMVNTAEEARRAAAACRYPADGGERGFATRRATGYGRMPLREYLEHSHGEPLVFVQIEHRDAVRNIDGILAAPGVDGVCIGPFDLSASYGKTGDFRDPEIAAAIDLVREKTLAADFCSAASVRIRNSGERASCTGRRSPPTRMHCSAPTVRCCRVNVPYKRKNES